MWEGREGRCRVDEIKIVLLEVAERVDWLRKGNERRREEVGLQKRRADVEGSGLCSFVAQVADAVLTRRVCLVEAAAVALARSTSVANLRLSFELRPATRWSRRRSAREGAEQRPPTRLAYPDAMGAPTQRRWHGRRSL